MRDDGLQLSEDRRTQKCFWAAQRLAWAGFGVFMIMAIAGFTGGGGYFSHQTLQFNQTRMDVPRIARWSASDYLRVEVSGSEQSEIMLGPGFLEYFNIEWIQPQPTSSEATPSGLRLEFAISGERPATILFAIRASKPGWASFELSAGNGTKAASALVLP